MTNFIIGALGRDENRLVRPKRENPEMAGLYGIILT
jgi:hypothetical protein